MSSSRLPWRRSRGLRRQLSSALVVTALLSVLTFGGLNFIAAGELLLRGTEEQLNAAGAAGAAAIDAGADRLVGEISVTSATRALGQALEEFTQSFAELEDERFTRQQRAELEDWYQAEVIDPLAEAGLGSVPLAAVFPSTRSAQYLQYHYTMRDPNEPPPVDAGDGSAYSAINARHTVAFEELSRSRGGGDVILIDDSGTIVYTLHKDPDLGANLLSEPWSQTSLGEVVTDSLPRARIGTTLLTDFAVSQSGDPVLYAVSGVRSGPALLGALAIEIPVEALNGITNAAGEALDDDLHDADSYIVASDRVLQSEPKAWREDPEAYLDQLRAGDETDQTEADLIEFFGSPVGIQKVETAPVLAALDGENFTGVTGNYFEEETFAAAEAFAPGGRQWVVVTEVPSATVGDPLRRYLWRIVLVLAVILPVVAALGIWISRRFTRPIRPTVEAAEAIVAGDRHPKVDTTRGDEFGDLGRRLTSMADSLAAHESELAQEYERTRQLLLAVLPPQLVDDDGKVVGTGDEIGPATAVAATVVPRYQDEDRENALEALGRAAELAEEIATETGLERIRVSADRYLFLAGIGTQDTAADAALEFASRFRDRVGVDIADVSLDVHMGLSSGTVATGVFDTGALTFGAWGDPVRRALALASLAQADSLLIDATTAADAAATWPLERARDIVDLDDVPMDLFSLVAPASPPR